MPRNSSGTYSLPETPFIPGTTVQSAPVNSNFSDIATAITTSLATTGVSTMTGPLKHASGTVSAPSLTFANALGTGWYLSDVNEVTYVINGVPAITYNADATVDFTGAITLPNVDNADVNSLDWYEEGTFTPALTFGGGSTGLTYTTRVGRYTRIGDRVFFDLFIQINSNGSSIGTALVGGLPYDCDGNVVAALGCWDIFSDGDDTLPHSFAIINDTTQGMNMYFIDPINGARAAFTEELLIDGVKLAVNGSYKALV